MISKTSITKIFSNLFKKQHGAIGDRNIMHPEREWFFGIFGGLLFLIAGLFWSISIYTQFSDVSTENATEINSDDTYRESLVESALIDLAERQRSYDEIEAKLFNQINSLPAKPVEEEIIVEEEEALPIEEEELLPAEEAPRTLDGLPELVN